MFALIAFILAALLAFLGAFFHLNTGEVNLSLIVLGLIATGLALTPIGPPMPRIERH